MNKILIFLLWLLGLAGIAWLCDRMDAVAPVTAPALGVPSAAVPSTAVDTPKAPLPAPVTAPASAAATVPAPAPLAAPSAPAPIAAKPAVQAAMSRIDEVLRAKVVEFRSGSATLTGAGRATLAEISAVLKDNPSFNFEVQGHTDNTGTEAGNLALSQARADAVKAHLTRLGVTPRSMTAKGYGSTRPVAGNDSADGRARNRRIAFSIEENK